MHYDIVSEEAKLGVDMWIAYVVNKYALPYQPNVKLAQT